MIDPLLKVLLDFRQTLIRFGLAKEDEQIFQKIADFLKRHNKK